MAKKATIASFADDLVKKRKAVLETFFKENVEAVKKWEQLKMEFESAKFKKDYIKKNELFSDEENPQLKLFGSDGV